MNEIPVWRQELIKMLELASRSAERAHAAVYEYRASMQRMIDHGVQPDVERERMRQDVLRRAKICAINSQRRAAQQAAKAFGLRIALVRSWHTE